MTLEKFAEIMDTFIEECHVQLMVEMPEGTQEAVITDNTGVGPVMQYYILLAAIKQVFSELVKVASLDEDESETFIANIVEVLKHDLLEEFR